MIRNVFLGLGSNFGNRLEYLKKAVSLIKSDNSINFIKASSVYETEPWGIKEQPGFLNMAIEIKTDLDATALLRFLKDVEIKVGRVKRDKWKEREIDIDILYFDDKIIEEKDFYVPHKEIANRRFVLEPLNEIACNFVHPVLNKNTTELLKDTKDISGINKFCEFDQ